MGRQTQFHMLEADCRQFLEFVQSRDPVLVITRYSASSEIEAVREPWQKGALYCLWNQSVFESLKRESARQGDKNRYALDLDLPLIEFSYPSPAPTEWNGRPALLQGRVWASSSAFAKDFERWYMAVVRWIRKNFRSCPVPLGGFVGPAAYEWYKRGGVLLPSFLPPITPSWISWLEAQDQQRAVFK